MSDTVQFPTDQMSEKSQTIQTQTANLTDETSSHIQQMQQHHSNLPTSMQSPFGDFIGSMQQRLSNGLNVHGQISKLLGQAANVSGDTDTGIVSGFNGFTD